MSKLFLMAGTKGGIGKSLVASLLADMAFDRKYRPVLFDCDDENRTFSRAYGNAGTDYLVFEMSMKGKGRKVFPLDSVVNKIVKTERDKKHFPGENAFIIDMKAGTSADTMQWLKRFPFGDLKAIDIESNIVGIVTAEIDSVVTLAPWLKEYLGANIDSQVRFSVIKNEVAGDDFSFYNKKMSGLFSVAKVKCQTCKLIDWGDQYQKLIQGKDSSFGRVATGRTKIEDFGFMDDYRIRMYYKETCEEFAPLFDSIAPVQTPEIREEISDGAK